MRVFLEAKEIAFEELDISTDLEARRVMTEQHGSGETPTLVIFSGEMREVVVGFDPVRLDHLLDPAPSSDSVTES
jgi:glutaredoxin